jgi:hypothetical protein
MIKEKFFGISLTISSLVILSFNTSVTGAVIGISQNNLNFISLILLILGCALFLHGNNLEDLAKKIKQASSAEIRRIANKMGYKEGREVKEGYQIIYNENPLTVIPHHNPSKGVRYSIAKSLITGKPTFRQNYSNYN